MKRMCASDAEHRYRGRSSRSPRHSQTSSELTRKGEAKEQNLVADTSSFGKRNKPPRSETSLREARAGRRRVTLFNGGSSGGEKRARETRSTVPPFCAQHHFARRVVLYRFFVFVCFWVSPLGSFICFPGASAGCIPGSGRQRRTRPLSRTHTCRLCD